MPLELKLLGVPPKTGGSPEDATKYVMDQVARVRGLIKTGMLTPE